MKKKDYMSPEFTFCHVTLCDVLTVSNPRIPDPEQPVTGVDEGEDGNLF